MELAQVRYLQKNILKKMAVDLTKVPNTPGVYKFFSNYEIIYIGKAKNLKKRVSSYFVNSFKDRKTAQIKFKAIPATPVSTPVKESKKPLKNKAINIKIISPANKFP